MDAVSLVDLVAVVVVHLLLLMWGLLRSKQGRPLLQHGRSFVTFGHLPNKQPLCSTHRKSTWSYTVCQLCSLAFLDSHCWPWNLSRLAVSWQRPTQHRPRQKNHARTMQSQHQDAETGSRMCSHLKHYLCRLNLNHFIKSLYARIAL